MLSIMIDERKLRTTRLQNQTPEKGRQTPFLKADQTMSTSTETLTPPAVASPYSRKTPFLAELIGHERLTRPGSLKDTRHFVLSLAGSGLTYTPGDSLGAFGCNSPAVVDELLAWLEFGPRTSVPDPKGQPTTLRETLLRDYIVNRANRKIISGLAQRIPLGEQRTRLIEILEDDDLLCEYIDTRDYVDVLTDFDEARFESPTAFLAQLTPVTPRLYSIASSPQAHPGEVHLCVAVVRYDTHGRAKKGLASGFLADHAGLFAKNVPVYVQESRSFRLPNDPAADIIMCGPGARSGPFPCLSRTTVGRRRHRPELALLRRAAPSDGFSLRAGVAGLSAAGASAPAGPGLLA